MRKSRTNVNVKTTLKAGQPAGAWLDALEKRAVETVRDLPPQAQALVTSPRVREVAGELLWWPFGPPRL
jgi:hypothetical protein